MSFMFNPYPYDDLTALNRPALTRGTVADLTTGEDAVARRLAGKILKLREVKKGNPVMVAFDGYPGAEWQRTLKLLRRELQESGLVMRDYDVSECYKTPEELDRMLAEYLPKDREIDPVLLFGKLFRGGADSLFNSDVLDKRMADWQSSGAGDDAAQIVCVYGCGAAMDCLRSRHDLIVYFDLTPMRVALKVLAGKLKPLGDPRERPVKAIFRRLYYYDYEIAMRLRQELLQSGELSYYVDSNRPDRINMLSGEEFLTILDEVAQMPFRCKPVYLEGVWGGQFAKRLRDLPDDMRNCAWVFDLIPNEVSLLVKVGGHTLEVPFPTFFRAAAENLLGEESVKRFGRIFPIRFNYDDTYGGDGNMSIQVHPPKAYAKRNFGEPFQQDESYYVVKTGGSRTYLGFRDEADTDEFFEKVLCSEKERKGFDYEKYVNAFESREGDQFLMPGGTLHSSGRNQVVLEIGSCTVGSYTFKMYDYLRLDLNGSPRPIHSKHAMKVVNTACRRSTADGVLRPVPRVLREGDGWKEELLGEHEDIFFSLRRLSFERHVQDDTAGKFHVLVLVEGEEALVYAVGQPDRCYRMRNCDMVVVPAATGEYGIMNLGRNSCRMTKTLLK
ncbi:MAG: class I mannose-6-phosphate isomerase [Kiritimatiellia bacterium]